MPRDFIELSRSNTNQVGEYERPYRKQEGGGGGEGGCVYYQTAQTEKAESEAQGAFA